jgi:hypothetical protein
MDHNDKAAIDGLFDRLRQAEATTGPRDAEAEAHIRETLARQPAAPYYMAQAVLVQEHALNALNARVEELERELANRPAGGGFLGGLFGAPKPAEQPPMYRRPDPMATNMNQFQQAPRGSFLAGALQTAAGVAGGVLLGNLIAGMFAGEAQAAEPQPEPEAAEDDFGGAFGDDEEF